MPETYDQLLDRAADLWGIEPQFWDVWGKLHVTSADTKRAILRALGVAADDLDGLRNAIRDRSEQEWSRLLPPCLVASENEQPLQLLLSLPEQLSHQVACIEIRREDGQTESFHFELGALGDSSTAELNGRRFVRKSISLPTRVPLGYHDVEASIGQELRATLRLIIAPERAYVPPVLESGRRGGIAIQLYGVRSERNWGCGDFTDLRRIVDWAAEDARAGFVALNPLHSIHNRRPFNTSPYLPNSVFYRNFIYLDVTAIECFQRCTRAQRMWASPPIQAEIAALRASETVEYERVAALKLRFLRILFVSFTRNAFVGSESAAPFLAFIAGEGDLLDRFATHCALDAAMHTRDPEVWTWTDWPESFQSPDAPGTRMFQEKRSRQILFHKYVQWQISMQVSEAQKYARAKGMEIGLYHDLALATDRFGADFWAHRPFYVSGCRVGAPPDDFSPKGQDWAFPPPNSEHHRQSGYRMFTEAIRKNCRQGGALRIDHVMRFFRLYWIPDGADATQGAYVRDYSTDLIRILALESVRNKVVVIGEDLGTVEPHVRETLDRFGIFSYRLFYFEKNERGDFRASQEYPESALVSVTTHDLPTLAGFWINEDIEARRRAGVLPGEEAYRMLLIEREREKQKMLDVLFRLGLLPAWFPRSASQIPELTGELHYAVFGFLASTPSKLMLANQEDLTKEIAQQNLPATVWQYPNWSRKMKFTVEQLRSELMARDFTAMLRHWLERTGRVSDQ